VRRAARQAIAEIQSRLTSATPGQLALADGQTGQLSLAEEHGEGRVSLADAGESSRAREGEEEWPTDARAPAVDVAPGDEEDGPTPPRPPKRETE